MSLQGAHIRPEAARLFPKEWATPPVSPEISSWLEWVWRAWQRLTLDRPLYGGGMGPAIPGRIPWQTVRDWAVHHGQDALFLDKAVIAMDGVYLEWTLAQLKKSP